MRYIGSKKNLLEQIETLLAKHVTGDEETFLDLFAGTNVVGNYFKKDYTIYSNDLLYFSYVHAKAIIENNQGLKFAKLAEKGIMNPLDYLQNAEVRGQFKGSDYYQKAYSPKGQRMYLSSENASEIDFIRATIDSWQKAELLTEHEYFYLVATLIEAIPFVSNTTGTYGAYLKHWDKRALKPLELAPLKVINNHRVNQAFNEDANELVKKLSADIVYIDTPYNNRQYASNYHLLENIARNNHPILKGKTNIFDWSPLRSDYAMKRQALQAMDDLLGSIDSTHIILSYNNEGIIPEAELITLLEKYAVNGEIEIQRIPYRKYKSKIESASYELYELLIYFQRKELPTCQVKPVVKPVVENWEAPKKKYIKSPLNYVGGKYKLLPQLLPLFPPKIKTFVDLFSGGANVGINVPAEHHLFNDMNHRINEMFRYFSDKDPDMLVEQIKERIATANLSKTNEAAYLAFRQAYNQQPNPLDLYVLVSYSYNYQFRFNNAMGFNNPFGRNRSQFSENMEKNLKLFINQLAKMNAIFTDGLFTDLDLSSLGSGDFVYLDPPYLITTGSYNDGNRGFLNWGEEQELAMYQLMRQLTQQGVRYALSNVVEHKGQTNLLLKEFIQTTPTHVHYLDFNYDHASHNTKGTGSLEVVVTNYQPADFELLK